jgi:hypothetical protein
MSTWRSTSALPCPVRPSKDCAGHLRKKSAGKWQRRLSSICGYVDGSFDWGMERSGMAPDEVEDRARHVRARYSGFRPSQPRNG